MKKTDDINWLKSVYDINKNKPVKTKCCKISCISDIPNFYNFEIMINTNPSYLTSMLPLGGINMLWKFLENICMDNQSTILNYGLEGPEQFLIVLNDCKANKQIINLSRLYSNNLRDERLNSYEQSSEYDDELNNNFIRVINISNSWFVSVKDKINNTIEMRQIFSNRDFIVHFDILIEKKQFILEFYKELFAMFYEKQIPKYDAVGQEVILKSKILRDYFKQLSDEDLLSLKNTKSQNISGIKINWYK